MSVRQLEVACIAPDSVRFATDGAAITVPGEAVLAEEVKLED